VLIALGDSIMTSFMRIESYIGRQEQKELLKSYINRVLDDDARCQVIYFEGQGGIGKTFLLQQLPAIAAEVHRDISVANIVDFYDFENRKPILPRKNFLTIGIAYQQQRSM
jgi:hypothetical protein